MPSAEIKKSFGFYKFWSDKLSKNWIFDNKNSNLINKKRILGFFLAMVSFI